ncbi:MAG: site-specific integrase, partial [Oscillospiraceae bacterium]|nr:site-specific integrase [Oscillospiraceae bacterium]
MDEFKMSDNEILAKAIQSGIINLSNVTEQLEMKERKELIAEHLDKYKIWIGKNGKYYTYLPDETKPYGKKIVKRNDEDGIYKAIVTYYKTNINEPTVYQVFKSWVSDKYEYGEISKQTYDKYLTSFKRFFQNEHVSFSSEKVKYVTEESLEQFIKTNISKLGLAQKAYSDMRTLIYGIFKYAKKRHYTAISITNFMGDLDLPKNMFTKKVIKKENEVFSEEEIPKIIDYLEKQGDIHSLGLSLAFQTGVRVGELSALKFSDVNSKTIHGSGVIKHYLSIERTEIKVKDENDKWIHLVRDYPKTEAGVRNIIITEKTVKLLAKIRSINPFGEYMFM